MNVDINQVFNVHNLADLLHLAFCDKTPVELTELRAGKNFCTYECEDVLENPWEGKERSVWLKYATELQGFCELVAMKETCEDRQNQLKVNLLGDCITIAKMFYNFKTVSPALHRLIFNMILNND